MNQNVKKILGLGLLGIAAAYVVIQGNYVLSKKFDGGNGVFTEWFYVQKADWPIGETLYTKITPMDPKVSEEFPPEDKLEVRRFFYKKFYTDKRADGSVEEIIKEDILGRKVVLNRDKDYSSNRDEFDHADSYLAQKRFQ